MRLADLTAGASEESSEASSLPLIAFACFVHNRKNVVPIMGAVDIKVRKVGCFYLALLHFNQDLAKALSCMERLRVYAVKNA
jgi:hypothetical protein